MCNIISYGFTVNGNDVSGPTCNATTSDILGVKVSISIDASDVGNSLIASVSIFFNDTLIQGYASPSYTPAYSPGIWTFNIPFTGLTTQVGKYRIGAGFLPCAYIFSPDYATRYCESCGAFRCNEVTVSTPPIVCPTPAVTLTIPG